MSIVQSSIVIAAVLLLGVTRANAAPESPAATAILVSGTATAHHRELAAKTVETVARDLGAPVAGNNFSAKDASTITGCVTAAQAWGCIAPVIRGRGLEQVAVVSLTNDTGPDKSPMVVITQQIIVMHLDTAVSAQRFCVRCTDDVLVSLTSELTRALLQEIAVRSGRTVVTISSTPRGARILFDGNSIGATDRSFNTFPGTHTIELELDGYRRESRSVDAALDKTSTLSVTLRPLNARPPTSSGGPPPSDPGRPRGLLPKLAMGAGAVAVVAGAIVLAFDEDSATKPIGSEQPRQYRDTIAPGATLVIGGAVVGIGGYLWLRYTRATIAPAVAPTAGGATVGFFKAF